MAKWKGPPHENIPRCGAKTRSGGKCGHYSMKNGRCRYHGGKSTGAKVPIVKHGLYTKAAKAEAKILRQFIGDCDELIGDLNK